MAGPAGGVAVFQKGLVFDGIVTAVISPTEFRCAGLTGFGNQFFAGWSAFVVRKADGTGNPPQGEGPLCLTYNSSNGDFTHVAYTVPLSVGDELNLLHPSIYAFALQLIKLAGGSQVGVHAHANNIVPQLVFEWTPFTERRKVHSIWLDFVNLTQNTVYYLSSMIDGVNYRIFDSNLAAPWTPALDDGVLIAVNSVIETSFLLEIESQVLEGVGRNVPFRVIYEDMT